MHYRETLRLLAMELFRATDQWIENQKQVHRERGLGETVCDGCTLCGCCKQAVLATFVEVVPAALHILQEGIDDDALRELKEIGEAQEHGLEVEGGTDESFPCPFLKPEYERGSCWLYEYRPVICRGYYAFETRDRCVPYAERTDGLRPTIAILDHSELMSRSLMCSIMVAEDCGLPKLPYVRSFPLMLAVVIDALQSPTEDGFWLTILSDGAMPFDRWQRITEVQLKEESEGQFRRY